MKRIKYKNEDKSSVIFSILIIIWCVCWATYELIMTFCSDSYHFIFFLIHLICGVSYVYRLKDKITIEEIIEPDFKNISSI